MSLPRSDDNEGCWKIPQQHPTLASEEVHIWKVQLSPSESQLTRLTHLLSLDEQARAARFKFPQHQQAFVTARGVLRIILSRYLRTSPRDLTFGQGPHGKPFLTIPTTPHLSFNVSHSHHLALYAVTWNKEIGVDIEYHRSQVDDEALIERVCSKEEKAQLAILSPHQRKQGFFACWTRKESYVKANGTGITTPLEHITVSLPPTDSVELLDVKGDKHEASRWYMQEIPVDAHYSAALTVAGTDHLISTWIWSWKDWEDCSND